jgi:hypothetical protein
LGAAGTPAASSSYSETVERLSAGRTGKDAAQQGGQPITGRRGGKGREDPSHRGQLAVGEGDRPRRPGRDACHRHLDKAGKLTVKLSFMGREQRHNGTDKVDGKKLKIQGQIKETLTLKTLDDKDWVRVDSMGKETEYKKADKEEACLSLVQQENCQCDVFVSAPGPVLPSA